MSVGSLDPAYHMNILSSADSVSANTIQLPKYMVPPLTEEAALMFVLSAYTYASPRKIHLVGVKLTMTMARALEEYVSMRPGFRVFNVSKTTADPDAFSVLLAAAERNFTLLQLVNLSGVKLTTEQCGILARLIGRNPDIMGINLSFTGLTSEGLCEIIGGIRAHDKLASFTFAGNSVDDAAIPDIVRFLEGHGKLEQFTFNGNRFSPAGTLAVVRALANTPRITSFSLTKNHLDDGMCREIALVLQKLPGCTKLLIGNNGITCAGLSHILEATQNMANVSSLDVQGNPLTDEAVPLLAEWLSKRRATLKKLVVSNCGFSTAGLAALFQVLQQLSLEQLWIRQETRIENSVLAQYKRQFKAINNFQI